MSEMLRAARVASPGTVLRRELEERGWTQKDLATIMQRPAQAISEIITGEKRITEATALELARALGTSPEFWLNLETNHRLWRARQQEEAERSDEITKKARLYSLVPVSDLLKRGWIAREEIEDGVCRLLGIQSPYDEPRLAASFRHSTARAPSPGAQLAWVKRIDAVAAGARLAPFRLTELERALPELAAHAMRPEGSGRALQMLTELGVAVAVVPHLPRTYADGVVYRRDDGTPVIGLSLRHDRLYNFWFTLLHEVAHLVAEHPGAHLDDLDSEETTADEREANELARTWLVPPDSQAAFVRSNRRISRASLVAFAARMERHPSIVLGQLQHQKVVPYSHFRDLHEKVSPHLAGWISD